MQIVVSLFTSSHEAITRKVDSIIFICVDIFVYLFTYCMIIYLSFVLAGKIVSSSC